MNAQEQAQRLLDYFRDLPDDKVRQSRGTIYNDSSGCFGAHIDKALSESDYGPFHFTDGAKAFGDILRSVDPIRPHANLFYDQGINSPYGITPWPRRPYDVLCDMFDDIGLIPKEPEEGLEPA